MGTFFDSKLAQTIILVVGLITSILLTLGVISDEAKASIDSVVPVLIQAITEVVAVLGVLGIIVRKDGQVSELKQRAEIAELKAKAEVAEMKVQIAELKAK